LANVNQLIELLKLFIERKLVDIGRLFRIFITLLLKMFSWYLFSTRAESVILMSSSLSAGAEVEEADIVPAEA
jgi:hypothetical protein